MTVGRILDRKGHQAFSITESSTLKDAISQLAKHAVGVLVVVNAAGDLVGILSERDVMKALATGADSNKLAVASAMTRLLVSCSLDDTEGDVMDRMGKANVRHLPVKHFGKLVGVVSARDILKFRIERLEELMKDIRAQAGA